MRTAGLNGLLLLAALIPAVVSADVVVPPESANVSLSSNSIPWNLSPGVLFCESGGQRYQLLFEGVDIGKDVIRELRFRQGGFDECCGPAPPQRVEADYEDVTIVMSATPQVTISAEFEANYGAERMVVFEGTVSFRSDESDAIPRPFDWRIPLDSTFAFDGLSGSNLLVDFFIPNCRAPGGINGVFVDSAGDLQRAQAGDVDSTMAEATDRGGSVTLFITETIFREGFEGQAVD
jgi:hypothetical protein